VLVQAIMSAIDDYAERETGNREYFWKPTHSAGVDFPHVQLYIGLYRVTE
jgi:hypothetical protein